MLDFVKTGADLIDPKNLSLKIDGKPVTNLQDFRFGFPAPVSIGPLPANNVLGLPAGATSSLVLNGYAVMLKPLPVGTHTIEFHARADFRPAGGPEASQDISYTITVVPRGRF